MKSVCSSNNLSLAEIQEIVSKIAAKYGVDRVYLFGSRARGDNEENSDFDFCVKPGQIEDLIQLGCFINELEMSLGKKVDVVTEHSLSNEFAREIMHDRRLIYEVQC